jgi:hypothetical protein
MLSNIHRRKMIKLFPEYLSHSVSRSSRIIFVRHIWGFSNTIDLETLDIFILYVCFVDLCLSFCTFSFGHCVVCYSSIYGFWLPLWYLQTLLSETDRWWTQLLRKGKQFLLHLWYPSCKLSITVIYHAVWLYCIFFWWIHNQRYLQTLLSETEISFGLFNLP